MRFHDPLFLFLLLIPLLMLLRRRDRSSPALAVADITMMSHLPETLSCRAARLLPGLQLLVLALLIVALARPQAVRREATELTRAADLMIALDLSTSMLAEDATQPPPRKNRLTIAKEVLGDFLRRRAGDRAGLIAFAARPYPAAPLTLDHPWLTGAVERLQIGAVEDGTALGDGLLAALNRLRDKPAKSSAVILITDGRNNSGTPPETAAAVAATLGIRVHTVGIGSSGSTIFPTEDPLGGVSYRTVEADLDEAALRGIAAATGGSYFRADDKKGLEQTFAAIDRLEKRPVEQKIFFSYRELAPFCIGTAVTLLLTAWLLKLTLLRRIP